MKDPKPPTLEELLSEYHKQTPAPQEGRTAEEWKTEWNISGPRTRELLRYALSTGRMKTTKVTRPDMFRPGRRVWVFLHSFVPKKRMSRS